MVYRNGWDIGVEKRVLWRGRGRIRGLGFFAVLLSAAIWMGCAGGKLTHRVNDADMTQVSADAALTLKPQEDAVRQAEAALVRAKEAIEQAKEQISSAEGEIKAAKADISAAKAEMKAAKANDDGVRLEGAERQLAMADKVLAIKKARKRWAEKELDAAKAAEKEAEAALNLARAEYELARVLLLADQRAPASEKYAIVGFRTQVAKLKEIHSKAEALSAKRQAAATQARAKWESLKSAS